MNTIVYRVRDFLKEHHPFSFLSLEEQIEISTQISVHYFENDEFIFLYNAPLLQHFFVVKQGAVGLYNSNNQLVEQCDEGDLFGLRAIVRKDAYKLSAKAIEDCIIYAIPSSLYQTILSKNPLVTQFLLKNFISNLGQIETEKIPQNSLKEEELLANYSKNTITCSSETSIKDAAKLMAIHDVGSIIIEENQKPIGIVTDKDFRRKIATGMVTIEENVAKIMSSPVVCAGTNVTVAEAQIQLLQHKISHLCITKTGKNDATIQGVLSEHDIILIRENNPSALIKQVRRAKNIEDLKKIRLQSSNLLFRYLQQNLDIDFITKIISEITNVITKRIIEFATEKQATKPPIEFSWLSLGSQGRREQLLLTDQDNAIVFKDSFENEENRNYFLKLASEVTQSLHEIGFEYCPANMMASNKEWCLSTKEWCTKYEQWISKPVPENIIFCTIFFDIEAIYGNQDLENSVFKSIYSSIEKNSLFLNFLALNSLQNPPPLGFFRQFLVEESGEQKEQFDIKARAMMPLVDAARLLSLTYKISVRNTLHRLNELIIFEPQNQEIYQDCIYSYKTLLLFRTKYGLKNNNSGRFIDLQSLDKSEKLKLKKCFKAVKEIQSLIMNRYQLANFM